MHTHTYTVTFKLNNTPIERVLDDAAAHVLVGENFTLAWIAAPVVAFDFTTFLVHESSVEEFCADMAQSLAIEFVGVHTPNTHA